MIILQAKNISKSFGDEAIFKDLNLSINEKEKVGLLGSNGSGKTTLLKCLTGELEVDSGSIFRSKSLKLGYLAQINTEHIGKSIWDVVMDCFTDILEKRKLISELEHKIAQTAGAELDELMNQYARLVEEYERADGYSCENLARRILTGLGFAQQDFSSSAQNLSGGQKTRLRLACLLASSPDLLVLDEPTNHLDIKSVEWLEDYLKGFNGTVLIVSHDRMFINNIATAVMDLRGGKLSYYQGNYQSYLVQREIADQSLWQAYKKQQEHIKKTEEYIRRFKAGIKSKQARGRQSQLDRLERIEAPDQEKRLKLKSISPIQDSAQDVLILQDISKAFGEHKILESVSFSLKKGDKAALIGPNGSGKTTLLKMIVGRLRPDQGSIRIGSRVQAAYFSQEFEDLTPNKTLLEEIMDSFDINNEEARTSLGSMLFSGDDVFKTVGSLSGGEKGRLAFLKIFLSGANLLILDEPTNHMDIGSCQIIERILQDYQGTILMVSHDRYFLDQIVDRVIALEDNRVASYLGNYSYYYEKRQERTDVTNEISKSQQTALSQNQINRIREKEKQKEQKRVQKAIEAIEYNIQELEEEKKQLENILADNSIYLDPDKAKHYSDSYDQVCSDLEMALEKWVKLSEGLQ